MRQGSVPIGRILGIELRIHALLMVVILWALVDHWLIQDHGDDGSDLVLIGVALLSLLLHELAHAWMARRFGRALGPVVLGPVSVSWVSHRATPGEDAWIAAAGPGANLAVAACLWFSREVLCDPGVLRNFLSSALWIQLALGLGNLAPLHPMDGGKIVLSLLERSMDPAAARRFTQGIGLGFGLLLSFGCLWVRSPWCWAGVFVLALTLLGPARSLLRERASTREVHGS